ncbi:hypothetical protein WJX73_008296 [Symbiochloris irregularis]|uniref:Calcium-dependent protein kinase n=1 Tax=Symbiochloris irregularis TaxID=706552 RepID=A0AAW1NYS0_9CHLO
MSAQQVLKKSSSSKVSDNYLLGRILGKGAFGTVYVATNRKTSHAYACKSIDKAKLVSEEDRQDIQREVDVLNLVGQHPNVAELYHVFEDAKHVHLVLELCKGGELFDRVVSKGTFTEKMAADFFRTMVTVVEHMHQLGIMHRDIKPENFLLTTEDDSAVIKLADFGLSTYYKPGQRFNQIVGSAYYVAPEVLRRDYSFEADMWSLGVILYILLSGLPPFWGDTEEDIFKMVLKGDVDFKTAPWPNISAEAKDCVRKLLTMNPKQRPTADKILQHPWLKQQGAAPDKPIDNIVLTRMRKFAAMNKMKQAALCVMAKQLQPADIEGLQQLFKTIDTDNSGTITVDEMKAAIAKMGNKVQDADLLEVMNAADLDKSGTIDYEEFIVATINLSKLEREAGCHEAFLHFDTDGDGVITRQEIRQALISRGITEDEISTMLDQYDINKDGSIDYAEFQAMIRSNDTELQQASDFFRGGGIKQVSFV